MSRGKVDVLWHDGSPQADRGQARATASRNAAFALSRQIDTCGLASDWICRTAAFGLRRLMSHRRELQDP